MERKIVYRDRTDHKILFVVVSLLAFGLVMIYSVAAAQENLRLFYKQIACVAAGSLVVFFFRRVKVDFFVYRISPFVYAGAYLLIFALKGPASITVTVNGATRWLRLGPVNFQVAEYVKLAVILMLACWIEYTRYRKGLLEEFCFIFCGWVIGVLPAGLLYMISNDLSSSLVVLGITFIMTFVASRGKLGWIMHVLAVIGVAAVVVFCVYYVSQHMPTEAQVQADEVSFRLARIAAWLHPERYATTIAYQSVHCLYAIANGGWFGKGLGQSWQKASLPESENDLIFAIIVEELGIFGGLVLIFLFIVLVTLICKVAYSTRNLYDRMVCTGIASHIMLQVIIHCGVCTNLIPNTGIGLPFISSGLTAILFQLAEITFVLSVAHVHIFDRYDRERAMMLRTKRLNSQKYFMGKKARQTEARQDAIDRYSAIADEDMKEKSKKAAASRRTNRGLTMKNSLSHKPKGSPQTAKPKEGTARERQTAPGSGNRYSNSGSNRYGSSTNRYSSSGTNRYSSGTNRYSSGTNRYSSGTNHYGSNANRYSNSTNRYSNSSTNRYGNNSANRYGSSSNRYSNSSPNRYGSNTNRSGSGSNRSGSTVDERFQAYRRNQKKAPTSIYSWKYETEKENKPSGRRGGSDPDRKR